MDRRRVLACAALLASATLAPSAEQRAALDPGDVLARMAQRVEHYFGRARSFVSLEKVQIQRLGRDLSDISLPRHLEYELRVEWAAPDATNVAPEATVVRRLLRVNGRAPRPNDKPECMDPKSVSIEPLVVFLGPRQREQKFRWAGTARVNGRAAVMLDYAPLQPAQPAISWTKECVSVDVPGKMRARVWADPSTGEVLRLDERLVGMFEFDVPREYRLAGGPTTMVIDRADSSIRYRPVTFADPDETLMLPASVQTTTVWRNTGTPHVRIVQNFSNYRRFVTGARIVEGH